MPQNATKSHKTIQNPIKSERTKGNKKEQNPDNKILQSQRNQREPKGTKLSYFIAKS